MTYGYIRVSCDKQTVENQRFEILRFCERHGMVVDDWIEETVSGTRDYNRRQLGALLERVGQDDTIICSEISRLGRSLFMVMEILYRCTLKKCRVLSIKGDYHLSDDLQSMMLAFAFSLAAQLERTLIAQRTREALARKKAEGIVLGRPKGSVNASGCSKLLGKESLIRSMLQKGVSQRRIAKACSVSRSTLARYLKRTAPSAG